MKLVITELRDNLVEIDKKVTTVILAPFDTGVGAVPLSVATGKGQVLVGVGVADVDALAAGNDGDVLTADSAQPFGIKWASGGGGASALMYNKSGGSVVAGDVIINDYLNDRSFAVNSVLGDSRVIGVAGESIAANAEGKVLTFWGTITNLNVDAAGVRRGDFLIASNTPKRATSVGMVRIGYHIFALALTAKAAGSTGTISALLLPQVFVGGSAATAFAAGGNTTLFHASAEKFNFASSLWASIAGALPTGLCNAAGASNGSLAGYVISGASSSDSGLSVTQKMPFTTELFSALAVGANGSKMFSSVMNIGVAAYVPRSTSGATYYASILKLTFASDTGAFIAGVLSVARAFSATLSDGSVSGIFQGGQTTDTPTLSLIADKITFATDVVAAITSARPPAAITLLRPMNFPAAGVSYSAVAAATATNKLPHATWINSALASNPAVSALNAAVANNGNDIAYLSRQDVAQSFSRVTETFTSTPGATTIVDRGNPSSFNNGAI